MGAGLGAGVSRTLAFGAAGAASMTAMSPLPLPSGGRVLSSASVMYHGLGSSPRSLAMARSNLSLPSLMMTVGALPSLISAAVMVFFAPWKNWATTPSLVYSSVPVDFCVKTQPAAVRRSRVPTRYLVAPARTVVSVVFVMCSVPSVGARGPSFVAGSPSHTSRIPHSGGIVKLNQRPISPRPATTCSSLGRGGPAGDAGGVPSAGENCHPLMRASSLTSPADSLRCRRGCLRSLIAVPPVPRSAAPGGRFRPGRARTRHRT